MLEYLEALIGLSDYKTLRKASLALHVTQSALSKRIASLEEQLDTSLTQPNGKYLVLTPAGNRLVETSRPLVRELRAACRLEVGKRSGTLSIDVASSILLAGGARLLRRCQDVLPESNFHIHNYHASVAVERVSAGHTTLALVQGMAERHPELRTEHIWNQEMVIIPARLEKRAFSKPGPIHLMAIEESTAAWRYTRDQLRNSPWWDRIEISQRIQSFSAIIHLARHGFAHGIAPRELAHTLGVQDAELLSFPDAGVWVPVSLIGRPSFMALDYVGQCIETLKKEAVMQAIG